MTSRVCGLPDNCWLFDQVTESGLFSIVRLVAGGSDLTRVSHRTQVSGYTAVFRLSMIFHIFNA